MTNRCLTLQGPCKIVTAAATYVSVADVVLTVTKTFREQVSSLAGKVGSVLQKNVIELKFQPVPIPAYATTLIALQPTDIGTSIFGCDDAYCDIHARDGTKIRLLAAGVSDPPEVRMDPKQDLFGDVTFRAVVADETLLSTADSVKVISTASFTEPAEARDTSTWVSRGSKLNWGDTTPFDNITMESGATVKVTYELEDKEDSLSGYYDSKLIGVNVTVKFRPNALEEADLFEAYPVDGASALSGTQLADLARELIAIHSPANGGLKVTLPAAAPSPSASLTWGKGLRQGEWTMEAVGHLTEGVPDALYIIEVVATPVNTVAPTINDTTPTEANVLTRTLGTWTDNPDSTFATQWEISSDGTTGWASIGGATAATYTVVTGDVSKFLRVKVTATNDGGSTIAYSTATSAVAGL